jgi:hypothetical protein
MMAMVDAEAAPSNEVVDGTIEAQSAMESGDWIDAFFRWTALQHTAPEFEDAYVNAGIALRQLRQWPNGRQYSALTNDVAGGLPLDPNDSVAIVGNSGNILGSKYGKEIDDHGCIIRINRARTIGYEADVGSRTDLLYINQFKPEHEDDYRSIVPNVKHMLTRKRNIPRLRNIGIDWGRVSFFNNYEGFTRRRVYRILRRYVGEGIVDPRPPRSGIIMITCMLLLNNGKRTIDLYGFEDEDITGPNWSEHYYPGGATKSYEHLKYHCSVELEFKIISALKASSLIRLQT